MKSVTKRHLSSAACILIFLSFLLSGCQNTALSDPVQVTGYKLNTYVAVSAYTTGGHKTSELKEILNEALRICDTYELMFSRTNPDSILYKLNDGQITTVPHELGELISYGIQYADMSDGAFDITIGSVSSLWDFTSDNPAVPDDSDIQNALSYVDYTRLKLTENNDGTYSSYQNVEYLLNNNYHSFKGKLVCAGYDYNDDNAQSAIIKIYGDGNLLYTSPPMSNGTKAVDFDIDISNYKVLKINADIPNLIHGYYQTNVGIVDARLEKK